MFTGPNLYGHEDGTRVEHRSVALDPDSPLRALFLLPKLREGRPKPTLGGSQRSRSVHVGSVGLLFDPGSLGASVLFAHR